MATPSTKFLSVVYHLNAYLQRQTFPIYGFITSSSFYKDHTNSPRSIIHLFSPSKSPIMSSGRDIESGSAEAVRRWRLLDSIRVKHLFLGFLICAVIGVIIVMYAHILLPNTKPGWIFLFFMVSLALFMLKNADFQIGERRANVALTQEADSRFNVPHRTPRQNARTRLAPINRNFEKDHIVPDEDGIAPDTSEDEISLLPVHRYRVWSQQQIEDDELASNICLKQSTEGESSRSFAMQASGLDGGLKCTYPLL